MPQFPDEDDPRYGAFTVSALKEAADHKEAMEAAEKAMYEAMYNAWSLGATLQDIGRALDMTKQAAQYRIKKIIAEESQPVVTLAEDVPPWMVIASQRRGHRPTIVYSKRVGPKYVTFYDENDEQFVRVPRGTEISYTAQVRLIGDDA